MKKNRVFNILFIIFTVMVVVGIVSMVKTVVMPKEDVQDTDGFVVEDETTDEPEVVAKNEEGKKKKQPENNSQDKGKKDSQNEKLDITKDVNKKSGPTETPVVVTETPAPTEDPSIEYTDEDTVRKVQEKLNALGDDKYNCGDVDGLPIFPKTLPEMVQQIMVTTLLKVVRHKDSVIILVLLEIFKQKNREEEHEMS